MSDDIKYGLCEGEKCNRRGCAGLIETHEVKNCSCHINPPCSACTDPRNFCSTCEWEEKYDQHFNGFVVNEHPNRVEWVTGLPRPLDNTKIDWRIHEHTHFTMICRGVYPDGTGVDDVRKVVNGTFGGRFNYFGNGKFEFVAYTD